MEGRVGLALPKGAKGEAGGVEQRDSAGLENVPAPLGCDREKERREDEVVKTCTDRMKKVSPSGRGEILIIREAWDGQASGLVWRC